MQKRILDHRPSWKLDMMPGGMNITGNFYPVTSAITIQDMDNDMQLTVMNDRSQAGASLYDGRIELMQNRRSNFDDWRGLDEKIDEKDSDGNGVPVQASYYVQYFNRKARAPVQRLVQQVINRPVQHFFAFDVADPKPAKGQALDTQYSQLLEKTGLTGEIRFDMQPMGRNSILMKIANIKDTFDSNGEVQFTQVKLRELAEGLYMIANGEKPKHIQITETSLSGNQKYTTMAEKKPQWLVQESHWMEPKSGLSNDQGDSVIELQQ